MSVNFILDNRLCIMMRSLIVAPICLPEKNEDFLGKFGWAAGWGALNPGSRLRPKTLQSVDVPVIENRWVDFLCAFEMSCVYSFLHNLIFRVS